MRINPLAPQKGQNHQTRAHPANGWLVTFGDLLTLVLCFFLVVLLHSPIGPLGAAEVQEADELESENSQSDKASDGISIALTEGVKQTERRLVVRYLEEEFAQPTFELAEVAREKLHKAISSGGYPVLTAEVRTCVNGLESKRDSRWFDATARGLALWRHSLDILGGETPTELFLEQEPCLFDGEQKEQAVAAVSFKLDVERRES